MAVPLVCPQGHRWDSDTAGEASTSSAPSICPVCRAAAIPNPRTEAFVPEHPRLPDGARPGLATLPPTTAAAADDTAELPTIPGYEILGELGRGGMGVVYRAWQPELNRAVALKMVLAGAHAGSQELARFHTEAEAVARLQHPHIVQIYGVGRHGEHSYLVLEYIDGGSLAQQLTGAPLPARRAAELVETLARAVHYAHQRGIVHRDLTPGNVLLTADGLPKLTDFGLAKLLVGGGAVRTQSGAILGTPSYMAPEQAAGKTKETGPAVDVYGLGAILYELLTGRPPFRAATLLETLLQVQADEPVPPSRLQPKLPRDLGTTCLKALARSPERRYASAGELADDLQRWLNGEPIRARPVATWERGVNWVKRRPAVAALLLASSVAALALVGVGVALVYNARLEQSYQETTTALAEANFYRYFHHIARAQAGWRDGNMGPVEGLLEDCPPGQRAWEWSYLKRLCHGDLLTLRGHTDRVLSVAFSPDGTRLASASADGSVKIWDATTGRLLHTLTGHTDMISCVVFSPDGTRLASASQDRTVKVWDATTGQVALTLQGHTAVIRCVAFSPDGTRLASASHDRTVKVWNAATGQEAYTLRGHTDIVLSVAFSPDGTHLASASQEKIIKVWDATTCQVALTLQGHGGGIWSVAFSPDGTRLASASYDRTVKVWDVTSVRGEVTSPLLTLSGHTSDVRCVAFSPDGMRLASASFDRTLKIWEATSGQELRTVKGHASGVWGVAFSPDGARLASASWDGTVKVWDATRSEQVFTLRGHTREVGSAVFSPDGEQLASASGDRTVKVWDVTTGQVLRTLEGHTDGVLSVAFSRDGRRLASASWDQTVKVWDATSGQLLHTLLGHTDRVWGVAFSLDGKLASGSADGTVKVWDVSTGQVLCTLVGHPISRRGGLAFSPDGTLLASAGVDRTVKVWDAYTGQLVHTLLGHTDGVWCVAFSPDGRKLATGSSDGTVRVWDAITGQEARTLSGHASHVFGLAFSPDGTRLTSASGDQSVRVWDATTGQEILTCQGDNREFHSVAFSAGGTRLAAACLDGTVRVWDARPWTSDAAFEREALGLLDFLFAKPLRQADVLDYLRKAPTMRSQARQLALALVDRYREETDPEKYRQASWAVVRQPYLNAWQYDFALQQAQAASQLARGQANYRTALGMAQYRLGRYQEALATLTRPDPMSAGLPADLASLAMTQHRLGQKEQAQATLARLRQTASQAPWDKNEEAQAFLREAEKLMEAKPRAPKE